MGIRITPSKGYDIDFPEPKRSDFPDNFGGAVEFTLTKWAYNIFRFFGNALAGFFSGVGARFLEDLEPHILDLATPLFDWIERTPDAPPEIKQFFQRLRSGKHEIGTVLTQSIVGSAAGTATGNVVQALTMKWAQAILKWLRPSIPSVTDLIRGFRMGKVTGEYFDDLFGRTGTPTSLQSLYFALTETYPSFEAFMEYLRRHPEAHEHVFYWLKALGVDTQTFSWWPELRWNLLTTEMVFSAFFRGVLSEEEADAYLARIGWNEDERKYLKEISKNIPPLQDIIRMSVREAWNDATATKWGYDEERPTIVDEIIRKLGYDSDWALRYWRSHWELPSVTLGIEMVHRGIISEDEFKDLLRIADYPAGWRDRITKAIYTPFTRVDVRRMYKLGVLNYDEMVRAYMDLGYDREKAEKLAEFTQKYEADDTDTKPEQYRKMSLSLIQRAYNKGILTDDEMANAVENIGYTNGERDTIVSLFTFEKQVNQYPNFQDEYQREMKRLLADAYSAGLLTNTDFREYLKSIGIPSEEIEFLVTRSDFVFAMDTVSEQIKIIGDAYVEGRINDVEALERLGKLNLPSETITRLFQVWDNKRALPSRLLTETQYRQAVVDGSISIEEYRQTLFVLGYSEKDINILSDRLILALSPANAKRLIGTGNLSEKEYRMTLKRLGFSDEEIEHRLT